MAQGTIKTPKKYTTVKFVDSSITTDQYAQLSSGRPSVITQDNLIAVKSLDYQYWAVAQYGSTIRVYSTGSAPAWATNVTFNCRFYYYE